LTWNGAEGDLLQRPPWVTDKEGPGAEATAITLALQSRLGGRADWINQ